MGTVDDPNVGVAFALVIGAGAATALGAAVVFFPSLVKLASRRVLAGSLGISAGVMTYVSFVEILQKATGSFEDAGHSPENAYAYSTLCFFGGVVVMLLVDVCVKLLTKGHHPHSHDHPSQEGKEGDNHSHEEEVEVLAPHCVCCTEDAEKEIEEWQKMAGVADTVEPNEAKSEEDIGGATTEIPEHVELGNLGESEEKVEGGSDDGFEDSKMKAEKGNSDDFEENEKITSSGMTQEEEAAAIENKKLVNMGINTALAIGLHNFPEGLATFVAALDDPRVGAVLAIAIGIHNIPEGLCVALPIYYATGNRWKAFMWALVSGASEPIAALLGWAVLANSFSDDLYAILFGFVAGMMVIISTRELLPTAHRYDPEDTVVTYSFIGGMFIMALSLVLFAL